MDGAQTTMSLGPSVRGSRGSQEKRLRREMFLARLSRIRELKAFYGGELTAEARRLIDRAMYSTYWDCVRLGAKEEARSALGLIDG